jgi:hypothetical protein
MQFGKCISLSIICIQIHTFPTLTDRNESRKYQQSMETPHRCGHQIESFDQGMDHFLLVIKYLINVLIYRNNKAWKQPCSTSSFENKLTHANTNCMRREGDQKGPGVVSGHYVCYTYAGGETGTEKERSCNKHSLRGIMNPEFEIDVNEAIQGWRDVIKQLPESFDHAKKLYRKRNPLRFCRLSRILMIY